ncbi:hypothetical protein FQA47_005101 [Oryzias melastigma]|uniref:Uncharacterized protein n=1 Tax=Oryzias melastigma TaxID=30732 RepID=A0A834KW64_ORYME|nr:hypothetical protein FQA47_005101 [Oryzias melastigma]
MDDECLSNRTETFGGSPAWKLAALSGEKGCRRSGAGGLRAKDVAQLGLRFPLTRTESRKRNDSPVQPRKSSPQMMSLICSMAMCHRYPPRRRAGLSTRAVLLLSGGVNSEPPLHKHTTTTTGWIFGPCRYPCSRRGTMSDKQQQQP